jgi:hypothetical protein
LPPFLSAEVSLSLSLSLLSLSLSAEWLSLSFSLSAENEGGEWGNIEKYKEGENGKLDYNKGSGWEKGKGKRK